MREPYHLNRFLWRKFANYSRTLVVDGLVSTEWQCFAADLFVLHPGPAIRHSGPLSADLSA